MTEIVRRTVEFPLAGGVTLIVVALLGKVPLTSSALLTVSATGELKPYDDTTVTFV